MPSLRTPDDIRADLGRKFKRQCAAWLQGQGDWPLKLSLGIPTSAEAERILDLIPAWVASWRQWSGPGNVEWTERRWRNVGTQQLPKSLILATPSEVAEVLNQGASWCRASQRLVLFVTLWPALQVCIGDYYDILAAYPDDDIARLVALLKWLELNPQSHFYPRQLPVDGLDTKWFETRQALIANLLAALRGVPRGPCSPIEFCGLVGDQTLIRTRVLDAELRRCLGGLGDFAAPASELAKMVLPVRRVFIVENLQPGLTFGELEGSIVFMGLGYALDQLTDVKWLQEVSVYYWGDIDTHGFAILSMARKQWPQIQSLLMDEGTLLEYERFWGREDKQHPAESLPSLTGVEQELYASLRTNRWRGCVRLEQERIPWAVAWEAITSVFVGTRES